MTLFNLFYISVVKVVEVRLKVIDTKQFKSNNYINSNPLVSENSFFVVLCRQYRIFSALVVNLLYEAQPTCAEKIKLYPTILSAIDNLQSDIKINKQNDLLFLLTS